MVKDLKAHATVFHLKWMTDQLVNQGLGKILNKNLKSVEEVALLETLMKESHENETTNLKTGKRMK